MTPRDLLLGRHKAADAKLDNIRRAAIAGLRQGAPARCEMAPPSRGRQPLNPFRWHLMGLTAAWLVVVLLNLSSATQPLSSPSRTDRRNAEDPLLAVRENRQQFLELIEAASGAPAAAVGQPRRRGSLQSTNTAV